MMGEFMATENMSVAECPGCGQKVRFPTDRGFIKFKCPACSRGLEWGTPPAEPDVMDAVIEGDDAPSTPTQDTTASFYDAVKAAAPQQASPAATASPASQTAQPAANTEHKPRLLALVYFAASVAVGVATEWFDRQTDGEDFYMLLFIVCVFSTFYLFFRGIRVATRFGVGGSIAALVGVSFFLSAIMPYVRQLDISGFDNPFEPEELAEGHFKGASKNTTPSEMDDLMEDW